MNGTLHPRRKQKDCRACPPPCGPRPAKAGAIRLSLSSHHAAAFAVLSVLFLLASACSNDTDDISPAKPGDSAADVDSSEIADVDSIAIADVDSSDIADSGVDDVSDTGEQSDLDSADVESPDACPAEAGCPCADAKCDSPGGCEYGVLLPGESTCTTDWSVISDSLKAKLDKLPSPPAMALAVTWPKHSPQVRWDTLKAKPLPAGWTAASGCSSGLWDPKRVSAGSSYNDKAGKAKCWAAVGDGTFFGGVNPSAFHFRTRKTHKWQDPVVGDPAWVQARFPIPPGHQMKVLDIGLEKPRLFGYPTKLCADYWTNPDGSCNPNTAEPWSKIAPGLYVLWTQPGATHYIITGPHLASTQPLSWKSITLSLAVPKPLQQVSELVVAVLVYRQHPSKCWLKMDPKTGKPLLDKAGKPLKDCVDGYAGNNLQLTSLMLETRATALSDVKPPLKHPRLFGANAQWLADQKPFEDMPCITIKQSAGVIGDLENIKNLWDRETLGAVPCLSEALPKLAAHPDISPYLQKISAIDALKAQQKWKPDPSSVLHAIRRTRACLSGPAPKSCQSTSKGLTDIIKAFKTVEFDDFDDIKWCGFCFSGPGKGYGLYTGPRVFYWSLFVDTLWDDLTKAEHAKVGGKLSELIDYFLAHGDNRHWALFNGNNWTPALVQGALAWAITYYHEDPRALDVAVLGIGAMWRHHDFWKADGAYEEGVSYGGHALNPTMLVTRMFRRSFGVDPHFMAWDHLRKAGQWYTDLMATDGSTLDFGDSHTGVGWRANAPLAAALVDEWAFDKPSTIDPCVARDYWAHKYYHHGFTGPWTMHPWMARDWPAIIAACKAKSLAIQIRTYPDGGWSVIKTSQPGSSGLTKGLATNHKGHDADKTMLAASSVPNTYAHMEADFGSLIWSAYGSRLIADIGYGSQAKDIYALTKMEKGSLYNMVDNGAVGHSTLYVPEANFINPANKLLMNSSQIKGGIGTTKKGTWGDTAGVHLDGAFVYGKVMGNPVYAEAKKRGWLEAFDRWLIPLPGGHFLVADSFLKRADRPKVTAAQTWQFYHAPLAPNAPCKYNKVHTDVALVNTHTVEIKPVCRMLSYSANSQAVGRILGASLSPGGFTKPVVFKTYKNLGGTVTHKRVRYQPTAAIAHDVRVFALLAAPSAAKMPAATLAHVKCKKAEDACFKLTLNGAATAIHFTWDGKRHVLSSVSLPGSG